MSNFTDFISGGGDAAPIPTAQFVIGESKTFTVPITGRMKVILTGGGGQGAFLRNANSTPNDNTGDGTGGGAGGYSEKTFNVTAGETFTVTIGAGGATTLAMNNISSSRVGNDGGNSSFVTASAAESVNMVANGGGGGQYSAYTNNAVTTAGGTGGTASGGDFNYTGGAGGSITRVAGCGNNAMTTGGGAVALYGSSYRGGNIDLSAAYTGYRVGATGGAGVGGNGGDIIFDTNQAYGGVSSGGSATKTGVSHSNISYNSSFNGPASSGGPTDLPTISIIDAQGEGSGGDYDYNESLNQLAPGGFGGGSGGGAGYNQGGSSNRYYRVFEGGGFGGGGACNYVSSTVSTSNSGHYAGAGGIGGGGSGAFSGRFHDMTSASNRRWSPGGDGMCIIMFV